MFRKLLKFELNLHTKQVGFWITALIMFLLGLLIMSVSGFSGNAVGEKVKANGAIQIAGIISSMNLALIFFGAVFTVTGAMRDDVHKSLEVIHSTPVDTKDMIWARFAGIFLIVFGCLTALVLGLFMGQFAPWLDKETLGPINPIHFLHPLFFYGLISSLLVTAFYVLMAGLTRNRTMVYISAIGLFLVLTVVGLLAEVDKLKSLAALLDPFGTAAILNETEFWPADDQNSRLVPFTKEVILNRLLWLFVSIVGIWFAQSLFNRGIVTRKVKNKLANTTAELTEQRGPLVQVQTAAPHGAKLSRFMTRFKYEYFTTVKSVPFIILFLLALSFFITVFFIRDQLNPEPLLLTGGQAFFLVQGGFTLFLLLMMVFFGGDIIWRERTVKITELVDSTSVQNWTLMAAKWLSLAAMIYTVIGLAVICALAAQAIIGVGELKPFLMFKRGFLELGVMMSFWAALVMFVQNFAPNRIVGMLAGGGLLFGIVFFLQLIPFFHPLMGYGQVGPGPFSDMNGYMTGRLIRMSRMTIYWGGLVGLFAVLSIWLWRRGTDARLMKRLKGLRGEIGLSTIAMAFISLIAFFGMGAHIFYKANIENTFYTDKKSEKRLVKIEKELKDVFLAPLPKIQSVSVDVDMYPSKQEVTFKGQYLIKNTTNKPLTELYLAMPSSHEEAIRQMDLKGAQRVTEHKNLSLAKELEMDFRLYTFSKPLAVGKTTTLDFDVFYHAPKFFDGGAMRKTANFMNNSRMPQLGIDYAFLNDPDKRRKYDLPKKDKRPDRADMDARQYNFFTKSADYVDFKANFCTDAGQIPIAPGKFTAERITNDGRVCRTYEAINPIMNFFSFLSAPYEAQKDVWNNPDGDNVDLAIYFHDDHPYNVDRMMEAMKSSLGTYTKTFGPYQYAQARIMEVPYVGFAQAFAGTIPFSENLGFIMDVEDGEDKIDFMTYVTAHELGHQWFGHQIVPADTKGFNVLSEGLTENASMTAYEIIRGYPMTRRMRTRRGDDYLAGRTGDKDPEPPLALAEGQQYLVYFKANMVFWGLKHYMKPGEMNAAIKGFVEDHGSKVPYPTTLELIAALRETAPEDLQQFITDSWDKITFWETGFGDVTVKPSNDGGFTVTAMAKMAKKYADEETGKETDADNLNEYVEIAFYKEDPSNSWEETPMLLKRFRLDKAETELTFELDERPGYIVIDPRALLVERKYNDNVKALPKKLASAE